MRRFAPLGLSVVIAVGAAAGPTRPLARFNGRIVDAVSGVPVADAIVTVGSREQRADSQGLFEVEAPPDGRIRVRAPGYLQADVRPDRSPASRVELRLTPFRPKALYLTVYGIGSAALRTEALRLIGTTELNALVIDMKGDRGIVPYRSAVPLAAAVGAQRVITIPDLPRLVAVLKAREIYTIARIVLFKDDLLASSRAQLALHRSAGSLFRDREGLAWADPYNTEVWAYNIDLAIEAAKAGFDEIQFDYVRFPDATGIASSRPWTQANREAAIGGFLMEARRALAPYNVFLAVDVFGYVCWNTDDTRIGQRLEQIARLVDYVSPMLYPSSFQFGIPGYRKPVDHPAEIVRLSLDQAARRTCVSPLHFRPWVQGFRDYAFGGRAFTPEMVRKQIDAAESFGADGWMVWNAQNRYQAAAFRAD